MFFVIVIFFSFSASPPADKQKTAVEILSISTFVHQAQLRAGWHCQKVDALIYI